MADGEIVIKTELDDKDAQKELNRLTKKIDDLNRKVSEDSNARLPLVEQAKQLGAELDAAQAKLYKMTQAPKGDFTTEQITRQKENVKALQAQYNGVQSQVERYDRSIQKANDDLEKSRDRAGVLAKRLAESGYNAEKMDKAVKKASKSSETFARRIKSVVRSALVFTVITQALAKFRSWVGKVIQTSDEARAAIARLKAALLTLAQPLVEVIIPAFVALVNALANVITFIGELFALITGKSYEVSKDSAESLYDEMEALEGVGSAAASAEKQLASFDEINRLSNTSGGGGANSSILPDFGSLQGGNIPSWLQNLVEKLKEIALTIKAKIEDFVFEWEEGDLFKDKDAWIVALSGALGFIIGSAFSGFGGGVIGLALGVAIAIVGLEWLDNLEDAEKWKRLALVALASVLGASLGALIAPAGILSKLRGGFVGLALGFSIAVVALEFLKGQSDGTWDKNKTWAIVLGSILGAVLGVALTPNPVNKLRNGVIGLSLGMAISVIALEFAEGEGYSSYDVVASLKGALGAILGAVLGSKLLGVFMALNPAAGALIGLALGLSISCISVIFDEDATAEAKQTAATLLKVVATTLIGAAIGMSIGGVFGGIVGGAIGLGLGLVISITGVTFENLGTAAKNAALGIAGETYVPSVSSTSTYSVPGLASGAVIPPNREFLAVLGDQKNGTNIEAPLSTIKQAVAEVLAGMGGSGEQTAYLVLDEQVLGKVVYRLNKSETNRIGVNLAGV